MGDDEKCELIRVGPLAHQVTCADINIFVLKQR